MIPEIHGAMSSLKLNAIFPQDGAPEPIVINGVTYVAPINGRKYMGFTGVKSPYL